MLVRTCEGKEVMEMREDFTEPSDLKMALTAFQEKIGKILLREPLTVVDALLREHQILRPLSGDLARDFGDAFAPANIALCKYWGKRNQELNLPVTSSVSVSLASKGAHTRISRRDGGDHLCLNDQHIRCDDPISRRLFSFLNLFRPSPDFYFDIVSSSSIPIGAGLASSASGFASIVLALDDFFAWSLPRQKLSILSRLGSGSAARSVYDGFVIWHRGNREDGMDCFAEPLEICWPEFRIGLLTLSSATKPISSRDAMRRTVEEALLYDVWPKKVASDLEIIQHALREKDIKKLGATAESNALCMHATMLGCQPPISYWLPETIEILRKIWALRNERGLGVYATIDAGPNVKLIFLEKESDALREEFPALEMIAPFKIKR